MKITDVLGCVGWVAFFLLAYALVPFVGPFFSLLIPLPFLYYSTKLGFSQGVKVAVFATFIIGLIVILAGRKQIILISLEFGLLGLALAQLFKGKYSLGQTVFWATIFMLLLSLGFLTYLGFSRNMGPLEMIDNYRQFNVEATIKTYKDMGIKQENIIEIETYGKFFMDIVSRIFPSLIIIGTGFAIWLNIVIAKPLFRIKKLKYPDFVPMDRWQVPDSLIWGLIISGFALLLPSEVIKFVAINILIVILAIYLFHGLSIAVFFLNKYHVPPWIRIGIYFLIIIQLLFLVVLVLAGIFDQWVDFRKIHRRVTT